MERMDPVGRSMTLEEYLDFEGQSPIKHEYVGGEVYAMSGVTTRHNLITLNIAFALRGKARRRCRAFASEVKLQVGDRIYYPDVILACGKAAAVEQIVAEPSLVVEVSSRSTRAIDRREKLEAYRGLPSLQTYLIVDQRRRHVLAYQREADGEWTRQELCANEEIRSPALRAGLTLDEIYDGIDLRPMTVREEEWGEYEDAMT